MDEQTAAAIQKLRDELASQELEKVSLYHLADLLACRLAVAELIIERNYEKRQAISMAQQVASEQLNKIQKRADGYIRDSIKGVEDYHANADPDAWSARTENIFGKLKRLFKSKRDFHIERNE